MAPRAARSLVAVTGVLLLALAAALCACSHSNSSSSPPGTALLIRGGGPDPDSLDPQREIGRAHV